VRDDYKQVYLESTSHPLAITPQAYEQIVTIAQANRICTHCLNGYTQENPQVAENVCLGCFLQRRTTSPTDLKFVGEVPSEYAERYGYQVYTFMDAKGYVYVRNSQQPLNDTLERDIRATLLHYDYKMPEQYTLKGGKVVDLNTYSWRTIYGDFTTSPVVLVTYRENYGDHLDTAFVLYRDHEPLEFSKRKNPTRQWYLETKAEIEATYQPRIGYVVSSGQDGEDRTSYQLYDSHLYPGIVARACQAYDKEKASTLS